MDIELSKRLTEVDEILKYLPKESFNKIPLNILEYINKNKDNNYIWKFDEEKKLYEQNLNNDTIAILSYINAEYLVNPEQKKFLYNLYKFNAISCNTETIGVSLE